MSLTAKKIAVFGGSFDPPTLLHRRAAKRLASEFDHVFIVPCGQRPDKGKPHAMRMALERMAMCDLNFYNLRPNITLDFFDIQHDKFTTTFEMQKHYERLGEIWHVVGGDLILGGADGCSEIQKKWSKGRWLWESLNFVVIPRPGYRFYLPDCPPHSKIIWLGADCSSTKARQAAKQNHSLRGLVTSEIETYISINELYQD